MLAKLVVGVNDLATLYPDIAAEWNTEMNGGRLPSEFTCGSGFRAQWKCAKCGNTWGTSIANRTRNNTGCPACGSMKSGLARAKPKPGKSLADKSPKAASEWHPTKNGDLTPYDVYNGSKTEVWWLCGKCGNEWHTPVRNRGVSGSGCPVCARKRR